MIDGVKFVWSIFVDEIAMKSQHKGVGSDTLRKCFLFVVIYVAFYLWVYYFKYETPIPRKIEWHRMVAAWMAGAGIFFSVGEYSVHLWRRIKFRRQQLGGS